MSGESDEVRRQVISEGIQQIPGAEPQLAQIDEWQRQNLIDACFRYAVDEKGNYLVGDTGEPLKICVYPDILVATTDIGHLEGTTHYTWEYAQAKVLDWYFTRFLPLKNKYKRDRSALNLLYGLKFIKDRQIMGDSMGASRQKYVVQLVGGDKMIRLLTNAEEKKGGLLKW